MQYIFLRPVLWSRIRDSVANGPWSRLHSYWLLWSLMSFGYTWPSSSSSS